MDIFFGQMKLNTNRCTRYLLHFMEGIVRYNFRVLLTIPFAIQSDWLNAEFFLYRNMISSTESTSSHTCTDLM